MCIIIAKNKASRLPSEEELRECFKNNSDGAGFMYTLNSNVIIDKGYMSIDKFLKRYNYLIRRFNNFNNKSLVIHFRIGTAGSNTPQNTHPYPITNDVTKLHKKYIKSKLGIAHNGIISNYNPSIGDNRDINDTQNFISTFLYNLYSNYKTFYNNADMIDAIEYLTHSKFAILDNKDNLKTIGDFVEDNGLLFSNSTYKAKTYTYYNYNTNSYDWNKYWEDYYDDYYNDYYNEDANTTTGENSKAEQLTYNTCLYDVPSHYFIEYNDDIYSSNNYCINEDGDLFKYNDELKDYDYITSDYLIYNDNFEPITWDEILL